MCYNNIYNKISKLFEFVYMKNRLFAIPIIILGLILSYLWLTYTGIYYQIGKKNIPDISVSSIYQFNEQSSAKPLIYVAMGDSLTCGFGADTYEDSFPYLIAEKLANEDKPVTLIPLAYPGIRTIDITENFLNQAIEIQPDIVTVLIGVNDIHNKDSLSTFKENYSDLILNLKTKTDAKIYLISIPFIGDSALMPYPWQKIFLARTIQFNNEIKKIAHDNNLEFIDITSDTQDLFKRRGIQYSDDHFHPSSFGYKIYNQLIYAGLNQ